MKTFDFKYVVLFPLFWASLTVAQDVLPQSSQDLSLGQRVLLAGTLPPWVARAEKLGPADDRRRVIITAYLRWKNQDELEQFIAAQTTPHSPQYGQFLTPARPGLFGDAQ
jgi:Pro-kumamolisin, activation domain